MVELDETIKVSSLTKTDLLERKKRGKHSSIDSLIRTTNLENDLLKKDVKELKEKYTSLRSDLKSVIKEKSQLEFENQELKRKLSELKQETENK